MLTLTDVRAELKHARDRLQCVRSDEDRDPVYVAKHHLLTSQHLRAKQDKLRFDYEHGAELVAEYLSLIDGYRTEIRMIVDGGERFRKMIKLIKQVNKLDKDNPIALRLEEQYFTAERVADLKTFVRGYRNEVERLRALPDTFHEEDALLTRTIELHEHRWDLFVENRRDRDMLREELFARIDQLERLAATMKDDTVVQRFQHAAAEAERLAAELAAEGVTL